MLNQDGIRELAYVVKIDDIEPIEGKDRVVAAVVGGWRVMVRKDAFKPGDLAVYFEIDSLAPADDERFAFLERYKYKIKTQKFKNFYSQGLVMSAEELGGHADVAYEENGAIPLLVINDKTWTEGDFLTQELRITYYDPDDQKRKSSVSVDKYKKMAQRHPKIFQKPFVRWLYKRNWGKKLLFVFFGKKKDNRSWPAWVKKTDEERVENMPYILKVKGPWVATEKIDGTSTTFTIKRGKGLFEKNDFYICSRNVCFDTPEKMAKGAYYDTNVYQEMAIRYSMEEVLNQMLKDIPSAETITIQGETFGAGIQKRDYGMTDHDFRAFNLIVNGERYGTMKMIGVLALYGIPCVPVLDEEYYLPDTVDELRDYVNSEKSTIDGEMKEGIVFRGPDGGMSFKCVSPEFLIKYHG